MSDIVEAGRRKQRKMDEAHAKKEQERTRRNMLAGLRLRDKLDNVEQIRRQRQYKCEMLGIDNEKKMYRTTQMLDQKEALKQARLASGKKLWKDKEDLVNEIEKLRRNQKWSELDKLVGKQMGGGGDEFSDEDDGPSTRSPRKAKDEGQDVW